MVSNAFEKSRNMPITESPFSRAFDILSASKISAIAAEWFFLNPNWNEYKILFVLRYSISQIYMTLSSTLENTGKTDIGR